jgi:hypothetical protein
VIPNGLDLRSYKPIDKMHARSLLNLPEDRHLLLFGTPVSLEDRNKGFHFLVSALDKIRHSGWNERMDLVVFGSSHMANREIPGFKVHMLGKLHDDLYPGPPPTRQRMRSSPRRSRKIFPTCSGIDRLRNPGDRIRIGGMVDLIEHRMNGISLNHSISTTWPWESDGSWRTGKDIAIYAGLAEKRRFGEFDIETRSADIFRLPVTAPYAR